MISYTLPCHRREADLLAVLPSVIDAAKMRCLLDVTVEIVVVDYGCVPPLPSLQPPHWHTPAWYGITVRVVRVEADHFHMAHARNVGIRAATGDVVVAFLADQVLPIDFFDLNIQPGSFLKWQETFAFHRQDIIDAGGFDERFEFYGPEGKELADRLKRRGLTEASFAPGISQIRTPNSEKVRHYRLPLSKQAMHNLGMDVWRDNQARGVTVANAGQDWGAVRVPAHA